MTGKKMIKWGMIFGTFLILFLIYQIDFIKKYIMSAEGGTDKSIPVAVSYPQADVQPDKGSDALNPLVSVVMSTYNRADLLPRAIESILNQTYKKFEFIIVDDGSTDNSVDVIQAYAQKDKRIQVFVNDKNRGISYSRNLGNSVATGKYIAVMDSDDKSKPDRLESQVLYMEYFSDVDVLTANSVYLGTNRLFDRDCWVSDMCGLFLVRGNTLGHPETMLRKSFFDEHHLTYNETYTSAVDYDLWVRAFMAGAKMAKLPKVVLEWRVHKTNPQSYYVDQKKNFLETQQKFLNFLGVSKTDITANKCRLVGKLMNNYHPRVQVSKERLKNFYINNKCGSDNE